MIDTVSHSSALATRLRDRIRREGPITFRDWMGSALYDKDEGYYCRELSRWGREGDYRTSPERSELFAATFARYFAKLHAELDNPEHWTIVEAGAGDGRFAEGLLTSLQKVFPPVYAATSYVIDEISSHSRSLAAERLARFGDRVQFKRLDEMTPFTGIVFSNELLDSFPVHRFTNRDGKLREFYVGVSDDGAFEWRLDAASPELLAGLDRVPQIEPREGNVVEVSFEIEAWFQESAANLQRGFVVTVDYGAENNSTSAEGTLRGFQRHRFVDDVLASPGAHDLTTSVNWDFVKPVGSRHGLRVVEFEPLPKFLLNAGLLEQLELETREAQGEAQELTMRTGAREMILPIGMAASFQVLVQEKCA